MTRNRLEDLGRLAVLLDDILESPIFHEDRRFGSGYYDWFATQDEDKKEEVLNRIVEGLQDIECAIEAASEIARGVDPLNKE